VAGRQGLSVGFVDVDGDGVDDKLVGAPYASTPSGVGVVLVYQGKDSGFSASPSMVIKGDDNLGFSLATLGDVDGDGKQDFAVGAINGASLSGSVTVYAGGAGGKVLAAVSGEQAMSKFGLVVSSGDLNADGKPDLIVGAPHYTQDPSRFQGGAIFVFLGPDFVSRLALYASAANGGLGWSAAAGDLNGDSVAESVHLGQRKGALLLRAERLRTRHRFA